MDRLGTRAFSVVAGIAAVGVPAVVRADEPVHVAIAETPPGRSTHDAVSAEPNRPRPLPVETEAPPRVPTERRLDIGVGPAFVARFAASEAGNAPSEVAYLPTLGVEAHIRIPIVEQVEVSPYLVVASHAVDVPDGSLGVDGSIETGSVTAMCFGARVARTFQIVPAVRVWGSAGVGYGRMEFGRMIAQEGARPAWEIRDRGASFVEFPFGIGGAYTVVPRWLSIDLEASAGPVIDKAGTAFRTARAIDDAGLVRRVGALPEIEATMVVALGLSLVL